MGRPSYEDSVADPKPEEINSCGWVGKGYSSPVEMVEQFQILMSPEESQINSDVLKRVSIACNLSEATCRELLMKGWTFVMSIDESSKWVQPGLRDGKHVR